MFLLSLIYYDEVIVIVVLGLVVNLLCVWLLCEILYEYGYGYLYEYYYEYGYYYYGYGYYDVNLCVVYIYVIVDVVILLLVIGVLFGGCFFGVLWLDLMMGIVGVVLVICWVIGLLCEFGVILFDVEMYYLVVEEVCDVVCE